MKALQIHINGEYYCIAGLENGDVAAAINTTDDGQTMLNVIGSGRDSEETFFWPAAALEFEDEVLIRIVEVDKADPPVPLE